jgi:hypothetical protein
MFCVWTADARASGLIDVLQWDELGLPPEKLDVLKALIPEIMAIAEAYALHLGADILAILMSLLTAFSARSNGAEARVHKDSAYMQPTCIFTLLVIPSGGGKVRMIIPRATHHF